MARDVAVQMCDTLEGKAYTGVVNVSYMAVANEVGGCSRTEVRICFCRLVGFLNDESRILETLLLSRALQFWRYRG